MVVEKVTKYIFNEKQELAYAIKVVRQRYILKRC